MKTGVSKTLWLISGVLLVFAGVLAIVAPSSILLSLTIVFGLTMLISGIISVAVYIFCSKHLYGAGWLLAEGILTALLGLFVLCDQVAMVSVIPYVFGLWSVFSGVIRAVDSLEIKRFGVNGWYWMMLVGVAEIVLGFATFIRPVIAIQIIGITMGIVFLLQGAASLFMWWFESRLQMK